MTSNSAYIGGFGNGRRTAQRAGEALGTDRVFTFTYALDNPEEVAKAVEGAKLYVHSAGINAAKDTRPSEIHAVAAPLPSRATGLALRTGVKIAKMEGHSLTGAEAFNAVNKYNASAVAELGRHPWKNLRQLRAIANTNSLELATAAQANGIPTVMYFMDRDDYGFKPTEEQAMFGRMMDIEVHMLEGRHDQLPLYPAQTLDQMNQLH